jgi:hypothetical protein
LVTTTSSVAPSEPRTRLAQTRSNSGVFHIGGAIAARASSQRAHDGANALAAASPH